MIMIIIIMWMGVCVCVCVCVSGIEAEENYVIPKPISQFTMHGCVCNLLFHF